MLSKWRILWIGILTLPLLVGFRPPTPPDPHHDTPLVLTSRESIPPAFSTSEDKGKSGIPGLEYQLAQIYLQSQKTPYPSSGDESVRVILEVDSEPVTDTLDPPIPEIVTQPEGEITIWHAAPVAIDPDLQAAIESTGATYETAHDQWVQITAPVGALAALAELPEVRRVRFPLAAQVQSLATQGITPQAGPVASEGIDLTNANNWHAAGYDGTGVHLAVFDFGFTGWATLQANGELPGGTSLITHDFSADYDFSPDTADYEHGAACAEIAYDMAPGVTLHLYAWSTEVEFAQAVADFRALVADRKTATMSITWLNAGPYDGTGPINEIVEDAVADGILWAGSSGNYRRQHWSGTATQYSTGDTVAFGTGDIQGFGPNPRTVRFIPAGTDISAYLAWNDWNSTRDGNANRIDYELELYRWLTSLQRWVRVTGSYDDQCNDPSVPPVENLIYTITDDGYYGLVISRYESGGCPNNFGHHMKLYTSNSFYEAGYGLRASFWYTNECNSLAIPADGDGVVAVGATFWGEDDLAPEYGLETFSSFGPRNGSGGAPPDYAVTKPDLVAPDGVSTATYGPADGDSFADGGSGFWGTSAAAPHAAGLAATMWTAYPAYGVAELRAHLQDEALTKGDGGSCDSGGMTTCEGVGIMGTMPNQRFGWGRIYAGDAPTAVDLARFEITTDGDTVLVTWETAMEIHNLGFNLYRAKSPDGEYVRLNERLIPSQDPGAAWGTTYTWQDTEVSPGATYYYRLEDIDLNGMRTFHGPVAAMVLRDEEPLAVSVSRLRAGDRPRSFLPIALLVSTMLLAYGWRRSRI